jgi:haloacetate dehalogenase
MANATRPEPVRFVISTRPEALQWTKRCPIALGAGRPLFPEDDPVIIWRAWADDVRGAAIDCGHHISEEAPDQLAQLLADFFAC